VLAEVDLIHHVSDHPWPWEWTRTQLWGMDVTLMSSAIAGMIVVGIVLAAVIIPLARRRIRSKHEIPTGAQSVVEVIIVFVRDMIARPALHDMAYEFLPYLLTLFVFLLGNNLLGIIPLEPLTNLVGLPSMGATPTAIASVCIALGLTTLMTIVFMGLRKQALRCRMERGWPMYLCYMASGFLWAKSLSPPISGTLGLILGVPLALLELVGVLTKCFALMVRLFANMLAGHVLLGVLMMFIMQSLAGFLREATPHVFYVAPVCILGSVAASILELLVAGLQAYIFTFLTAMFLGLYVEGHEESPEKTH